MAAALSLARIGMPVTLLEQSAQIGEIGAGLQLGPNAFAALDYRVPSWVKPRNVCYEVGDLLYQDFFAREGLPEHHALYDARANAFAFRERVPQSAVPGVR